MVASVPMPNAAVLTMMIRLRPMRSAIGTEHQRADHESEQAGAEHGSKGAARQFPILRDGRRDVADRLSVEPVDEQHGGANQQEADLETADRLPVDESRDVDRIRCTRVQRARWILGHLRLPGRFSFCWIMSMT